MLRIDPPKSPEMKSKGNLLGMFYPATKASPYAGSIRPAFPRSGPSRAEVSQTLPSGEMNDILHVMFDESTPERVVSVVLVSSEVMSSKSIVGGLTPELLTTADEGMR